PSPPPPTYRYDLGSEDSDHGIKNYGITSNYPRRKLESGPLKEYCQGGAVVMINDLDA
ncbi:hypothetical protein TeGR_g4313, partial [Tetraparma gracilis]